MPSLEKKVEWGGSRKKIKYIQRFEISAISQHYILSWWELFLETVLLCTGLELCVNWTKPKLLAVLLHLLPKC